MKNWLLTAATAATLAIGATGASALGVTISGTTASTPLVVNSFKGKLDDAGAMTFVQGSLVLTLDTDAILTFSLVGHESGFYNEFLIDDAPALSESSGGMVSTANFATGVLGTSISRAFSAGNISNRLSFRAVNSASTVIGTYGAGDNNFGIYFDGVVGDNITSFFLALDDTVQGPDDNHDDIIVRVDVAAIPLPAAAWLLLGVSGALVAAKRRAANKAAA